MRVECAAASLGALMNSVSIKVPASTSNLGSGFDTLGLAVKLYNVIRVERIAASRIEFDWELPADDRRWFCEALGAASKIFFRSAKVKSFGVRVGLKADVPMARGLGASATIRVGFIAALNELAGTQLSRAALLELATELEGHPDNASPAIFGGFTVSGRIGKSVRCLSVPVSSKLRCVTLIPKFGISTEVARKLLPAKYSKADAAHALNRAALITAAFASRRYEMLRGLFDDRVHQPYREKLLPQLSRVIAAGERAGALGGFLSGSGSSIMCLTIDKPLAVARAMHKALPDSAVTILTPDVKGFQVLPTK
ncbi:MAG: homoserine kinase [Verrucomicrobia bacterium]|nr:homoserine kinase [Verrucomicrobiota bacterium]